MTSILRQAEGRRKAPARTREHDNEHAQHQQQHHNVTNGQAKPADPPQRETPPNKSTGSDGRSKFQRYQYRKDNSKKSLLSS
jgi:hypothetical protein